MQLSEAEPLAPDQPFVSSLTSGGHIHYLVLTRPVTRDDKFFFSLRAESPGHDVSIRSFDTGRRKREKQGIEMGKLAERATA